MIRPTFRKTALVSLLALTVGMTACNSNDDDGILTDITDEVDDLTGDDEDDADTDAGGDVDAGGADAADGDDVVVTPENPATPVDSTVGSFTITFTNTSESQPMTPPVVALHNPPTADNGIRLFEATQPAIGEVIEIAENGNNAPLVGVIMGQIGQTIAAGGPAFVDPAAPGPVLPGQTASITLESTEENQVLSVVSMVVCTNDAFSGVDSRPIAEETFFAPIYDAGSETNVLTLNYWVPPCNGGESENITDDENGAIQLHPGQEGSENPIFDFPAESEFLEITVTRN